MGSKSKSSSSVKTSKSKESSGRQNGKMEFANSDLQPLAAQQDADEARREGDANHNHDKRDEDDDDAPAEGPNRC